MCLVDDWELSIDPAKIYPTPIKRQAKMSDLTTHLREMYKVPFVVMMDHEQRKFSKSYFTDSSSFKYKVSSFDIEAPRNTSMEEAASLFAQELKKQNKSMKVGRNVVDSDLYEFSRKSPHEPNDRGYWYSVVRTYMKAPWADLPGHFSPKKYVAYHIAKDHGIDPNILLTCDSETYMKQVAKKELDHKIDLAQRKQMIQIQEESQRLAEMRRQKELDWYRNVSLEDFKKQLSWFPEWEEEDLLPTLPKENIPLLDSREKKGLVIIGTVSVAAIGVYLIGLPYFFLFFLSLAVIEGIRLNMKLQKDLRRIREERRNLESIETRYKVESRKDRF